jgi:predicted MFS family arabinose efflux permease
LRVPEDRPVPASRSVTSQMRIGIRYVRRQPTLRALLISSVWFNAGFAGFQAMLVVFATNTNGLSPSALGLALGLGGIGVPVGLLLSGPVEDRVGMPVVLVGSAGFSAAGLLVVAAATGSAAALMIGGGTFITALGGGAWGVAALTTRQRVSAAEHRAMATALFRWASYGVMPLAALLSGAIGSAVGVRAALLTFGGVALLCVVPLLHAELPDFRKHLTWEQS